MFLHCVTAERPGHTWSSSMLMQFQYLNSTLLISLLVPGTLFSTANINSVYLSVILLLYETVNCCETMQHYVTVGIDGTFLNMLVIKARRQKLFQNRPKAARQKTAEKSGELGKNVRVRMMRHSFHSNTSLWPIGNLPCLYITFWYHLSCLKCNFPNVGQIKVFLS